MLVDTSRQCSASFVLRQFTLGGTVNGLSSGTLVLQLDSDSSPTTQTKSLTANGAYSFDTALDFGSHYEVSVQTQPAGLICTLAHAAGTLGAANVSNIAVHCSASTLTVSASVEDGLGTVTPETQEIASGGAATVTLSPVQDWEIDNISGTCAAGSLDGNVYTSGAITAPCTIEATFVTLPGHGLICRVAVDGVASNDGSSWSAAKDLHGALADPLCGELWLKQGVYRPSTSDRNLSFVVSHELKLYGGFDGSEVLRSQRNAREHRVILSGDVGSDDTNTDGNFIAETTADRVGNNSYHVLYLVGPGGTSITRATLIDGITITAAYAYDFSASYKNYGAGVYCHAADPESVCSPTLVDVEFHGNRASFDGGAMFNYANGADSISSPRLTRVLFSGNTAGNGGAMYNAATAQNNDSSEGGVNHSSPILTDVRFVNNSAFSSGAAMYNAASNDYSHCKPELNRVSFSNNIATTSGKGGAMANFAAGNQALLHVVLNQVTFSGNSARSGGAIHNDVFPYPLTLRMDLNHVTFVDNHSTLEGGALYSDDAQSASTTVEHHWNHVIAWGNTSGSQAAQASLSGSSLSVSNSIIEGGCVTGTGIQTSNGGVLDCGTGNGSGDPLLGPLQDNGGFSQTHEPGVGSSAIDSGDNASCGATDQRGVSRPLDGDANGSVICDIGAVEVAPDWSLNVTVNGTGSGSVSADVVPTPSSGSILDCGTGGSCSATYLQDSRVTLLATPANGGSVFAGWGGDCSPAGTSPTVQVLMQTHRNCSAAFQVNPQTTIFQNGFE